MAVISVPTAERVETEEPTVSMGRQNNMAAAVAVGLLPQNSPVQAALVEAEAADKT